MSSEIPLRRDGSARRWHDKVMLANGGLGDWHIDRVDVGDPGNQFLNLDRLWSRGPHSISSVGDVDEFRSVIEARDVKQLGNSSSGSGGIVSSDLT
jgi:hypothetical protein